MSAEQVTAEVAGIDFTGIAKVWKEAYLAGLEAGLRWQGENEYTAKSIMKQGILRSQQWLAFSKDYLDKSLEQIQAHQNENPFVALSRQVIQASYAVLEPVVNSAVDVCETTFKSYETTVSAPSRRHLLEINKKVMESVIPS